MSSIVPAVVDGGGVRRLRSGDTLVDPSSLAYLIERSQRIPTFGGAVLNASSAGDVPLQVQAHPSPGSSPALTVMDGLMLWLRPESIPGTGDGLPIASWPNAGDPGVTTSLYTNISSPVYRANAVNGRAAVEFARSAVLFTRVNDVRTMFYVVRENADSPLGTYLQTILGDSEQDGHFNRRWNYLQIYDVNKPLGHTVTRLDGVEVDPWATDLPRGSWHRVFTAVSQDRTINAIATDRLGNGWFYGRIAEVLIYNRLLSGDEYAAVDNYLIARYWTPQDGAPLARLRDEDGAIVQEVSRDGWLGIRRTPAAPLDVGGALRLAAVTKAAAYTLTLGDHMVDVDASAAPVAVTLPTAATGAGLVYEVTKVDASANAVSVVASGSDTVVGTTQVTAQYQALRVRSLGGTTWLAKAY